MKQPVFVGFNWNPSWVGEDDFIFPIFLNYPPNKHFAPENRPGSDRLPHYVSFREGKGDVFFQPLSFVEETSLFKNWGKIWWLIRPKSRLFSR